MPEPLTLRQMIGPVAIFGGFLARKGDGDPGRKSLRIGLQRFDDKTAGYRNAIAAIRNRSMSYGEAGWEKAAVEVAL